MSDRLTLFHKVLIDDGTPKGWLACFWDDDMRAAFSPELIASSVRILWSCKGVKPGDEPICRSCGGSGREK